MPSTKLLNNIPLTDFLDLVLGPVVEKISVPVHIASIIQAIDHDEQYCHIEFSQSANPVLWRIADWRTDYANQQRKKALSAKERLFYNHLTELRLAMQKRIQAMTSLPDDQAQDLASRLISTRNATLASTFGIDLAPLLEAEANFKAAQKK